MSGKSTKPNVVRQCGLNQSFKVMELFRELNPSEEIEFRQWARDNFYVSEPISPVWHPIVRDECEKIIAEENAKKFTENNQATLSFDDYEGIKDAYEEAVLHGQKSFEYKSRFFLVAYAKYLLQYMELRKNQG